MRLLNALKTDLRFQLKQGVYTVYVFLAFTYLIVINLLPKSIHSIAVPIVVFSDPSVIGFFFIGSIVMLEKNQGVFTYLAVTPLRLKEYLFSKIIAYAIVAEIAGFAIVFLTYREPFNVLLLFIGILLTSIFFTFLGLIATINCNTMNQYFLRMIPLMIIGVLPCLGALKPEIVWLNILPGLSALNIVFASFGNKNISVLLLSSAVLVLSNFLLYKLVMRKFTETTDFREA